jgi:hypothetical protein
MAGLMRKIIIAKLRQQFATDIDSRSGCILYNGWRTLTPGRLYVIGFNPGGEEKHGENIIESLFDSRLEMPNFSSYDPGQDRWGWRGKEMPIGWDHPHQNRVRELVAILGVDDISDVFSANAIFARSVNQASLVNSQALWEKCWPLHEFFLSIVHPKILLCLGHGPESSYSLMRVVVRAEQVVIGQGRGKALKMFRGRIELGSYGALDDCVIIGVPHPSRYPIAGYERHLTEVVKGLI